MSKSWQEKWEEVRVPQVKRLEIQFADIQPGQTMLISTPQDIALYINEIPEGELRDIPRMRRDLAKNADVDATCPVTTAIFTRIVAERSLELMAAGEQPLAPFWKVIDPESPLAEKLSCGAEYVRSQRNLG